MFLDFADAADNLGGAFSFHFEARKGRWGGFTDFNFVRLSSETEFTTVTPIVRTIEGDFNLDVQFFEAGASYVVHEPARVAVIGGLRTYTLGSKLEFSTPNVDLTAIDASRTVADVFVGFTRTSFAHPQAGAGRPGGHRWRGFGGNLVGAHRARVPRTAVDRARLRVQGPWDRRR